MVMKNFLGTGQGDVHLKVRIFQLEKTLHATCSLHTSEINSACVISGEERGGGGGGTVRAVVTIVLGKRLDAGVCVCGRLICLVTISEWQHTIVTVGHQHDMENEHTCIHMIKYIQ